MIHDTIIDELHQQRETHALRYGNDLKKIFAALTEKEAQSHYQFVNRGPNLLDLQK